MLTYRKTIIVFSVVMILLMALDYSYSVPYWIYLIVVALLIALISYGSYFIQSNFFVKASNTGPKTKAEIALTFDDGPHGNTPKILDVLRKNEAPATFFCIGKNITGREGIIQRAAAEGHLIGNHSYSHSSFIDFWPLERLKADAARADEAIESSIGRKPAFFRPPFGVTTPVIARLAAERGYSVIGWSVRSYDTSIKNRERLLKRIFRLMRNGSVILLHDSTPGIEIVVEQVLEQARRQNLKVVSLEKLFGIKAYD